MRTTLCVVLLSAAACRQGGVHGDQDQPLRATPAQLSFAGAWVGYPVSQTVTVFNPNRAPVSVSAVVAPPFSIDRASLGLGGGASLDLDVTFLAATPGHASGTLLLGGTPVALEGDAQPVPDCGAAKDCHTLHFDPDAGACASEPLADGTSCASPYNCFSAAECRGGECRGTTTTCDDHNPCTLDVCGATGCGHLDGVTSCPPPTDPCLAPVCDVDSGCGFAPVPDGFACGPRDCTSAKICVAARCVSRPVPQNQACVEVIAGAPGGKGTADGKARLARFVAPSSLAYDPAGTLYVADGTAIRTVAPNGTVTTLAGSVLDDGHADGFGPAARFSHIRQIVWFGGSLVVEDGCALRQVNPYGVVSTWIGQPNDCRVLDGIGSAARINGGPLAVTAQGTLALLDPAAEFFSDAGVPWREVSSIGEVLTRGNLDFSAMFTQGETLGSVSSLVDTPFGLAGCAYGQDLSFGLKGWWFELSDGGVRLHAEQNVCGRDAVDDGAGTVIPMTQLIERRLRDGGWEIVAGDGAIGSDDGPASTASFDVTLAVARGPSGELAIADYGNANLRLLKQGVVSTLAGPIPDRRVVDGPGATARFLYPWRVVAGADADAWLLDDGLVRHVDSTGAVSEVAGTEGCSYDVDGPGPQACFYSPWSLLLQAPGVLLVGDTKLRRVQLPSGYTTTVGPRYNDVIIGLAACQGLLALAEQGVVSLVDADGGLIPLSPPGSYVDALTATNDRFITNQQCGLYSLSLDGGWSLLGGDGGCGVIDGPLATAQFRQSQGLASDGTTIFAIDYATNRVRRIANGQVDTVIDLSDHPLSLAVEDGGTLLVVVDSAVLRVRP